MRSESMRWVALLRGLNVGGKNRMKMPALVDLFTSVGCKTVSTYIQSGNVLFEANPALAKRLPGLVEQRLADEHSISSPVVLRTAKAMAKVVKINPFLERGGPETGLHVGFLARAPTAQQVAGLDPQRSPPDAFAVLGSEVYLNCPQGLGRSKLTNAWFDSKLKTVCTLRNWATVMELARLSEGAP